MQKPYVFISYSTIDQEYADKVNQTLKDNGINTWIATEDIHGGESFATEITNGIKNCDAFIFILSQNSDNSPHCGNELSLAFSSRKKIIPFRLHEFNLSESNTYFLQQAQWIDYFAGEDWAFQELIKQLKIALFSEKVENTAVKSAPISKHSNLITRAELELETKAFGFASKYANEVLNEDASNYKAYLILLLCDFKVSSLEELIVSKVDFSNNVNYQRALRFANDEQKREIEEHFEKGKKLVEQKELEKKKSEDEILIKKIEKGGFKNSKITSITIPSSMTEISCDAFFGCKKLKSVIFEEGSQLESIGAYAFEGCESLTSIVIPDSVTTIGERAFCGCESLTSIVIPNGVTSVENSAFFACSKLKNVIIPASVENIGYQVFCLCPSLTNIEVDKNNKVYKSIDGNLYGYDSILEGDCLIQYAVGKTATSYILPSWVVGIERDALSGCTALTDIKVEDGNEDFTSIDGNLYSNYGESLIQYAIAKNDDSFTIPSGVKTICDSAFWLNSSLESVVIPEGVTSIEQYAFSECSSLMSLEIPSSVTSIDDSAFAESLEDLVIYGKTGSYAEEYANSLEIEFIDKELVKKQQEEERLEKERKERELIEKQKASYRQANVCQHCGGKFKGLFKKVCSVCGKEKDY